MDSMEYLNKIADATKNKKESSGLQKNFLSSKMIKFLIGALVALILIIVLGAILNSGSGKEQTLSETIILRSNNLMATIDTYNGQIKSSDLRSLGASLSTVLKSTSRDVAASISYEESGESLTNEETKFITDLNTILENARLNGMLDEVYESKMNLQISLIMSMESEILSRTSDQNLKTVITNSYQNLLNLQESFANLSNKTN